MRTVLSFLVVLAILVSGPRDGPSVAAKRLGIRVETLPSDSGRGWRVCAAGILTTCSGSSRSAGTSGSVRRVSRCLLPRFTPLRGKASL